MSQACAEPSWLADLAEPAAYGGEDACGGHSDAGAAHGDARAGIRRVDTHISHVFLTATRAYKIRRAVTLAFLDFSQPQERLADCLREVALNRRLAPDVYLGIAPVLVDGGRARIGPVGEAPSSDTRAVEHCVVMRRLPAGRDLLSMLARSLVTPSHIDRIAERLADFHSTHSLGRPAPYESDAWLSRTTAPARANFDALAQAPARLAPPHEVEDVRRLAAAFVESRRADFDARRETGRIVDGHGDLHCEHVWFERDDSEPLMIDCLEFRDDFRRIDAASDAAFLAMDLAYCRRPDFGARFLRRYARASGDYHLFTVVDYFLAYRALVRAKVASLVATDASMSQARRDTASESVRQHLDLALAFLCERPPGTLVVMCGTIGTGKSTVAEAMADATGGVVISSDRLRRGSASVDAPPAQTPYGGSRYTDTARAAVYERVFAEAGHVLRSGRVAILDATFSRRAWRELAMECARRHGSPAALVEVVAPKDEVIERLAVRAAAANDASEAGPGLYDAMRAEFEDPAEWPESHRVRIDSSAADWREQVTAAARTFGLT